MEPKKRWDGYVSFSYLEPGLNYREFELSPQTGRVEPFVYPLSDADHERAERLLREHVCISLHDHCGITPADMTQNDDYVRESREWYGYEGLAASGLDAVFESFRPSATRWGCTAGTRRRSTPARFSSTSPSSTSRGWRTRRSSRT
jgi:membrane dipeptidase